MLAGLVHEGTRRIDKAGQGVRPDAGLSVRPRRRFVSRGGDKLEAALERFSIDVSGRACLDAGCSTGGFTDCLLQRGAARVYAVDVGYGQFAWSLRQDPRVVLMERTNVRKVDPGALVPPPSVIVADLSFVSLRSVLPPLVSLAEAAEVDVTFVLLVKPQFEVAAAELDRGVVRSAEAREAAVQAVEAAVLASGLKPVGSMESPLPGADGNVEVLLVATRAGAVDFPRG